MHDLILPPRGRLRLGCQSVFGPWHHNDVLYEWAAIVSQLLAGPNNLPYWPSTMYLEFENNGGAAVTPPTFTREDGRSYYAGLGSSAHRDYLRVRVLPARIDSSDADLFPQGNRLTFLAQSEGSVGMNGKPYSSAAQSRVFGAALVASPVWSDPTQDLVFSRAYVTGSSQIVKPAGSVQIDGQWQLTLG